MTRPEQTRDFVSRLASGRYGSVTVALDLHPARARSWFCYVTKPVDRQTIEETIARLLTWPQENRDLLPA